MGKLLSVVTLMGLLTIACSAGADERAAPSTRVQLTVRCDDGALRNRIVSFVSRELRSLGDVEVADSDPNYKINIIAIAVTLKNGYAAGHALSVVITSPLGDWGWALSENLKADSRKSIEEIFSAHESLEDHRLFVGGEEHLRSSLEELVADFDATELEPMRRFRSELQKTRLQK